MDGDLPLHPSGLPLPLRHHHHHHHHQGRYPTLLWYSIRRYTKKEKKIEVVQCSAVAVPPCAVHSHPHPQTRSPFPFPAPDPNHPHSFLPLSFPKLLRTYRSTSYSPPMCKILVISIQPHNHTYTHTDNILRPQHVHATYAWLFSSPRVINHSIGRYDAYLRTLP